MNIRTFENVSPTLDSNVFVDETALIIGNVTVGSNSSIWPQTVVRGDVNSIDIGSGTNIQDQSMLHVTHAGKFSGDGFSLEVGDNVTVGHRVVLHGCKIADRVLIGMGAIIMDGAIIESDVVIAAGALVPPGKHLVSKHLYVGQPCKPVRELNAQELEHLLYSANYYQELAQRHQCKK